MTATLVIPKGSVTYALVMVIAAFGIHIMINIIATVQVSVNTVMAADGVLQMCHVLIVHRQGRMASLVMESVITAEVMANVAPVMAPDISSIR